MSVLSVRPMKFECQRCDKIYLHHYKPEQPYYPHCPHCQQAGLLLGMLEKEDLIRVPLDYASAYLKQTWHRLSK